MKKITAAAAALLLCISAAFTLCGCDDGRKSFSDGDISAVISGGSIKLDAAASDVIALLGDGYEYHEAISCAYDGLDKNYDYGGVILYTYPDSDTDRVNELVFLSADTGETGKGIRVGSSQGEVTAAYGDGCQTTGVYCNYVSSDGLSQLSFEIQDGIVVSWGISKTADAEI